MKRIFVIDWILIFIFASSACSGVELHIVGHENNHEIWHNWAVFHVLTSFLFLATVALHLATHRGWCKGIIKNGISNKNRATAILSIVFLLLSVTGIVLLGVAGANTRMGLWHYMIGLTTIPLSIGHILKRYPALRKSDRKASNGPTAPAKLKKIWHCLLLALSLRR